MTETDRRTARTAAETHPAKALATGPAAPDDAISNEVLFRETMAHMRHYSNLRFLMLPIFFSICYGIFFVLGEPDAGMPLGQKPWLMVFAIGTVTLAFMNLEFVLDRYILAFRVRAMKLSEDESFRLLPAALKMVMPTLFLVYALPLIAVLSQLLL